MNAKPLNWNDARWFVSVVAPVDPPSRRAKAAWLLSRWGLAPLRVLRREPPPPKPKASCFVVQPVVCLLPQPKHGD